MVTVGETLRSERIRRNLDLSDVSRELKIDSRFLKAIEEEHFDRLPGGVFARAFVRQYGRMLGLNEDDLAAQLQQQLEPPPPPEFTQKGRAPKPDLAPIQVPRMEEWQTVGDKRFKVPGSLSAAILVVVVILICSGVYTWLQRPHNPTTAQNTASVASPPPPLTPVQSAPPAAKPPAEPPATAPQQQTPQQQAPTQQAQAQPAPANANSEKPPAATAPPPQTPQQQTPATAPASTAAAEKAAPPPNPDATVHLELTFDEPGWVSARADGKFLFTGTMQAGQTKSAEGVKEVTLRLGNAGGVTITLNGKPLGPVGPKGQARTIQFTSGGFQIVPAKPPAADPLDRF